MWEIRFVFVQLKRCGKILKDKIIIGDAPCIIMKGGGKMGSVLS